MKKLFAVGFAALLGCFAFSAQAMAQDFGVSPFLENQGQWEKEVLYKTRAPLANVFVLEDGQLGYVFGAGTQDVEAEKAPDVVAIFEKFVGAEFAKVDGSGTDAKVMDLTLNGKSSKLAAYQELEFSEIYPGINLQLRALGAEVEKLFVVEAGADAGKIEIELAGQEKLSVNGDGELVIITGLGELIGSKPVAYQEIDGKQQVVDVEYRLIGEKRYGFELGQYDSKHAVVIDPFIRSNLLLDEDLAAYHLVGDMVRAEDGDIYVLDYAQDQPLPTTPGVFNPGPLGDLDLFVMHVDSDLQTVEALAYLGTAVTDNGNALAVNGGGLYVLGASASQNNPDQLPGFDPDRGGSVDSWLLLIDGGFTQVLAGTYIGGSAEDAMYDVELAGDRVFVAGRTRSNDIEINTGISDGLNYDGSQKRGRYDGYIGAYNLNLSSFLGGTYYGGDGDDEVRAISLGAVVENETNVQKIFMAGSTENDFQNSLPVNVNDYQTLLPNQYPFMGRVDFGLNGIEQVADFNGTLLDTDTLRITDVEYSEELEAFYASGYTNTFQLGIFPVHNYAFIPAFAGEMNGFIAGLKTDFSLGTGTALGRAENDYLHDLEIDDFGNIYSAGYVNDNGQNKAFSFVLNPDLTAKMGGDVRDDIAGAHRYYGLELVEPGVAVVGGVTNNQAFFVNGNNTTGRYSYLLGEEYYEMIPYCQTTAYEILRTHGQNVGEVFHLGQANVFDGNAGEFSSGNLSQWLHNIHGAVPVLGGNNFCLFDLRQLDEENPNDPNRFQPDRAATSDANSDFEFPLDTESFELAQTSGFYFLNRAHEYFEGLGFSDGVYQQVNEGASGTEGDPVHVYIGNTLNGIQAGPAADGFFAVLFVPRMEYLFDDQVLMHEYSHLVIARVVGEISDIGGSLASHAQWRMLQEGWADWFTANYDDDTTLFEYADQIFDVDRDFAVDENPHHFGNFYGFCQENCTEETRGYDGGEYWASVLWDIREMLVEEMGAVAGKTRAEQLVFQSMDALAYGPNMIDARDQILATNESQFNAEYQDEIWEIFSYRGMGPGASVNEDGSGVADFTLLETVHVCDNVSLGGLSVANTRMAADGRHVQYFDVEFEGIVLPEEVRVLIDQEIGVQQGGYFVWRPDQEEPFREFSPTGFGNEYVRLLPGESTIIQNGRASVTVRFAYTLNINHPAGEIERARALWICDGASSGWRGELDPSYEVFQSSLAFALNDSYVNQAEIVANGQDLQVYTVTIGGEHVDQINELRVLINKNGADSGPGYFVWNREGGFAKQGAGYGNDQIILNASSSRVAETDDSLTLKFLWTVLPENDGTVTEVNDISVIWYSNLPEFPLSGWRQTGTSFRTVPDPDYQLPVSLSSVSLEKESVIANGQDAQNLEFVFNEGADLRDLRVLVNYHDRNNFAGYFRWYGDDTPDFSTLGGARYGNENGVLDFENSAWVLDEVTGQLTVRFNWTVNEPAEVPQKIYYLWVNQDGSVRTSWVDSGLEFAVQ